MSGLAIRSAVFPVGRFRRIVTRMRPAAVGTFRFRAAFRYRNTSLKDRVLFPKPPVFLPAAK